MPRDTQNQTSQQLELKIRALKNDIKRFSRACRSEWSRPIDFVNLSDAQFKLKKLQAV